MKRNELIITDTRRHVRPVYDPPPPTLRDVGNFLMAVAQLRAQQPWGPIEVHITKTVRVRRRRRRKNRTVYIERY